jgi:glycosyltransferase involved in cell wall biosynthesis
VSTAEAPIERVSPSMSGVKKLAQIGISSTPICGVRDYAGVLKCAFSRSGIEAPLLWYMQDESASATSSLRQAHDWLARVRREIELMRPRAVILHYSVFAFGPRGLPLLAPAIARELDATGVPMVSLLHEFVYPFGRRGWRGTAQALSHRAVLPTVVRHSAALVTTTERRASWLTTRRWLPRRPTVPIPVFSNLPDIDTEAVPESAGLSIGVFGFSGPQIDVELVADAVAILREQGRDFELVLIGAPGSQGGAATRWRHAFQKRGCLSMLRFTGVQSQYSLARELARLAVLVFPDRDGPDSRRTTLAAGLALGKTVLALDGPERWERAVSERAFIVAPRHPRAFANELGRLLDDPTRRTSQGVHAAQFYRRLMAPELAVEQLLDVLALPPFAAQSTRLAGGN